MDPRPMLIRMVHVRPSLGPIPQPRQPRTLIRVPCDGPHALVAICRPILPCSFARHAGPAATPSWPPWRLRRLDHALRVTATAPAMSRTTTEPDVLRHWGRCPSFRDRLQRWKLHPETRSRAARDRDRAGHSRTHARRFGTATIHAGFGWVALSACFETRASACFALTAYAPFRASPR